MFMLRVSLQLHSQRKAGRMKCPAARQASGSEPLAGSPRVLQRARVAETIGLTGSIHGEGRASSRGARARLCIGGGRGGPRPRAKCWRCAQDRGVALCPPWRWLPPPPPLESTVSVFLAMNLVGCWLNLSFAETRTSVKTDVELLFSPRMAPRRPPCRPSHGPASARSARGDTLAPRHRLRSGRKGWHTEN